MSFDQTLEVLWLPEEEIITIIMRGSSAAGEYRCYCSSSLLGVILLCNRSCICLFFSGLPTAFIF